MLPTTVPTADASCVGPYLTLDESGGMPEPPVVVQRAATLRVHGRAFVTGCNDTGTTTGVLACQHTEMADEERPIEDIRLTLRQHGRTWELGTEDSAQDGEVDWSAAMPDGVRRGPARLVAHLPEDAGTRARLDIVVR